MCWFARVYWTVLHNLFVRFFNSVANLICNNNRYEYVCCGRHFYCCCSDCQKHKQNQHEQIFNELEYGPESSLTSAFDGRASSSSSANLQHDYVIVDDIDANYLQIERRKIETETYYRTVDRITAEDILTCREDGACLVRPYKEEDINIKYIVSICAQKQYFHLFIRQIGGKELYGIGQEKPNEKLFHTPSDIIDFYTYHPILCTNKTMSITLVLRPIVA